MAALLAIFSKSLRNNKLFLKSIFAHMHTRKTSVALYYDIECITENTNINININIKIM